MDYTHITVVGVHKFITVDWNMELIQTLKMHLPD